MMKTIIISDEDTLILYGFLGIPGILKDIDDDKFIEELDLIISDKNVGLVILSERNAERHKDYLDSIKRKRRLPIFVDIPSIVEG